MGGVVLRSRSAPRIAVTTVVMCAVAAVTGPRSLEIDLSARWPPTKLPVVELCTVLAATLLAILARPQFWESDRTATGHRAQTVAATSAAVTIALPALCVPTVALRLPPGTAWGWVLANALLLSTLVQLITPLLGPLAAGGITLLLWLGGGLTMNLAPGIWLPLGTYRNPHPPWALVVLLAAATIALHTRTRGQTAWAHRRYSTRAMTDENGAGARRCARRRLL